MRKKIITGQVGPGEVESWVRHGVDISKLTAGIAAALAGADVNTAAQTGENAAEHNIFAAAPALIALAGAIYSYIIGDGSVGKGLEEIGKGEDPLSKAVASGVQKAVEFSAEQYPEATKNVLGFLTQCQGYIDATVTYVDDATGNVVSSQWNSLDESTRNRLVGGGVIVALAIQGGEVGKLINLQKSVEELKYIETAASAAQKLKLRTVLSFQEAGILDAGGKLTEEAIKKSKKIVSGDVLSNEGVIKNLTQDGSNIADWAKYSTESVQMQNGQSMRIHYYKNNVTNKIDYITQDYKVKGVVKQ